MHQNLKTIVLVRHGECNHREFLTIDGRLGIEKLVSNLIVNQIDDQLGHIICSDRLRAFRTAHHLGPRVNIAARPTCYPELFSVESNCNTAGALEVILGHAHRTQVETLIVVSHLEMVERLPQVIARNMLKTQTFFPHTYVKYAQGFIIDCTRKTWKGLM